MPGLSQTLETIHLPTQDLANLEAEQVVHAESLDPHGSGDILMNMPDSHANFDPGTLTTNGLVKACRFFAEAAASNPALAEKQAERVINVMRQDAAMRQKGIDSDIIRSQKFASMRDRHREKTKVEQKSVTAPAVETAEPDKVADNKKEPVATADTNDSAQPPIVNDREHLPEYMPPQTTETAPSTASQEYPLRQPPRRAIKELYDDLHEGIDTEAGTVPITSTSPLKSKELPVLEPAINAEVVRSIRLEVSPPVLLSADSIEVEAQREAATLQRTVAKVFISDVIGAEEISEVSGGTTAEADTVTSDYDVSVVEAAIYKPKGMIETLVEGSEAAGPEIDSDSMLIDIAGNPNDPETPFLVLVTDEELAGEVFFEPETLEVYHQLAVLLQDKDEYRADVADPFASLIYEVVEPAHEKDSPIMSYENFENFIAAQPTAEEPVTLETIRAEAAETPVEHSLALVIDYLAEPLDTPEQNALREVVREIEAALPACYIAHEAAPPEIRITPEMTDNLLNLLRVLGYENPDDSLTGLVSRSGSAFLFDALAYICEMTGDDRHELLMASRASSTDGEDDTKLRLGKVLFGLIARRSPHYSFSA